MSDVMPTGWPLERLANICEPVSKKGPDKSESHFRYIDLASVDNDRKILIDAKTVATKNAPSRAKQQVRAGDVLFSTVRVYLENICFVPNELDGEIASTAFCILRPNRDLYSKYLYYYVASRSFVLAVNKLQRGNSPPSVQDGDVREQSIPLPTRSQQIAVADKIDELFSQIDEGERALKRVQTLVERYRQSVLKAAVTGELTRDWRAQQKNPPAESGKALLQRILKARRAAWEKAELDKMAAKGKTPANDAWRKKYKAPQTPDVRALPDLPSGWAWASLEQLCFVETGATPKRGTAEYYEGGTIPWVTSTAVNRPIINEAEETITQTAIEKTNAKVFATGSLIVAMYGEGKTRGKVSELGIDSATNQACAALLCNHLEAGVKQYIRTFFEKNYEAIRISSAGGVQPNLNLSKLREMLLPIPPIAEIAVINETVASHFAHIDATRAVLSSTKQLSSSLKQTILKTAFSDQLLSQNTAAYELGGLNHIAAETF